MAALTYTEMKAALDSGWPNTSNRMRAIAARYYIEAETLAGLRNLAQPVHVSGDCTLRPVLSADEIDEIIRLR
jgi:hypothetical protein